MSTNVPAKVPTVKLTKAVLQAPASVSEMLSLPAIESRWVETYEKISGKPDGGLRFEAEKILFSQAISANKALDKCDRLTVYASFIELAISGLSLRDGLSYIIPYGDKAQFQVGWKGRLEQINELPNVIHVQQPQVVYDCDEFDYEKGMKTIINKHKPAENRDEHAIIKHVYCVVQFDHGLEVYMMDRASVLDIRDNYSDSYKAYAKALGNDVNKGKKWGDKLTVKYKKDGVWKEFEGETPMWVSAEAQAFKKTLVKRIYDSLPKLPKHKALDDRLKQFLDANPDAVQDINAEDPDEKAQQQPKDITADDVADLTKVDEETGEYTDYVDIKNEGVTDPADLKPADETTQAEDLPEDGF